MSGRYKDDDADLGTSSISSGSSSMSFDSSSSTSSDSSRSRSKDRDRKRRHKKRRHHSSKRSRDRSRSHSKTKSSYHSKHRSRSSTKSRSTTKSPERQKCEKPSTPRKWDNFDVENDRENSQGNWDLCSDNRSNSSNHSIGKEQKDTGAQSNFNPAAKIALTVLEDKIEKPVPPPATVITKNFIQFGKPGKTVKPGIQMKLVPPKPKTESKPKLTVASAFNNDSDDEVEEMPAECKMRMRNIGRDTPTSSGPNSFGKTKKGFVDTHKVFERSLRQACADVD